MLAPLCRTFCLGARAFLIHIKRPTTAAHSGGMLINDFDASSTYQSHGLFYTASGFWECLFGTLRRYPDNAIPTRVGTQKNLQLRARNTAVLSYR
jgi:hypothetical protein